MGTKESKLSCISYDDAVKRVTEAEFEQIRETAKRLGSVNGTIPCHVFTRDILGDMVPFQHAELIYGVCGGSQKGIGFKDLLCCLVVLTRGSVDERCRFLFSVYAADNGQFITRTSLLRVVQHCESRTDVAGFHQLFKQDEERVGYAEFRAWLQQYGEVTELSSWLLGGAGGSLLLSDDEATPTFYQSLAGVTHLDENEIMELEQRYWAIKRSSRSGRVDRVVFGPLVAPSMPAALLDAFFDAFDENRDGHIDFKEMTCGVSAACRGPLFERLKFCFKVFDCDRDGKLNVHELRTMVDALSVLSTEALTSDRDSLVESILSGADSATYLTQEEFLIWSRDNPLLPDCFVSLVFQLCHVVLGLRPRSAVEEGDVVLGWLYRQEALGYRVGTMWYLVSVDWWNRWSRYVGHQLVIQGNVGVPVGRVGAASGSICAAATATTSVSSSSCGGDARALARSLSREYGAKADSVVARDNGPVVVTSVKTLPGNPSVECLRQSPAAARRLTHWPTTTTTASSCSTTTPPPSAAVSIVNGWTRASPQPPHLSGGGSCASLSADVEFQSSAAIRPGAIDNSALLQPSAYKVSNLTGEGGRLRTDVLLQRRYHFELVPECLWRALQSWYGGSPQLPRQVIQPAGGGSLELELYPLTIRLLRHYAPCAGGGGGGGGVAVSSLSSSASTAVSALSAAAAAAAAGVRFGQTSLSGELSTYSSLLGGSGSGGGSGGSNSGSGGTTRRYLAYTAAFSRLATVGQMYDFIGARLRLRPDDTRLWHVKDESNMSLWEDESCTLEQAGVCDNDQVLVEVRNRDQTWPEEMSILANLASQQGTAKNKLAPIEKGVTGLNNLGNTCFMNTALQCCSNTAILTRYFVENRHLYELNRRNPLGMKGHMALCYAELIRDIWSGSSRVIAPLKLRFAIGKYAPRFTGVQQHDAQELLAFLLDGLHEDLNRVHDKPYVELRDSEGRPDVVVAQEAWENHLLRNRSIIVDLFHGQLKSKVTCRCCGHESVRFDPFNVLSLPLPMENSLCLEITLVCMDGLVPVRYGVRLPIESTYATVKQHLLTAAKLTNTNLVICEVADGTIKYVVTDEQRVRAAVFGLYALQIPWPVCGGVVTSSSSAPSLSSTQQQLSATEATHSHTSCNGSLVDSEVPPAAVAQHLTLNGHATPPVVTDSGDNQALWDRTQHTEIDASDTDDSLASSRVNLTPHSPKLPTVADHSNHTAAATCSGGRCSWCDTPDQLGLSSCRRRGFMLGFHRKLERRENCLLSTHRLQPVLFGLPVIVPAACQDASHNATNECGGECGGDCGVSGAELYDRVWGLVSRLVSPPPSDSGVANHAQDCDDSLGYRYPFVLRCVNAGGLVCGWCGWQRLCRGCVIACSDGPLSTSSSSLHVLPAYLAIDWDPTALHLRYLVGQEKASEDDASVLENRRRQSEPISLRRCLQAFTGEETLAEQEKYYCCSCRSHQPALKKLQLWRLPPLLIVHMKRFQFVGGRWIKSQKVVDFPFDNFDPTDFLASVPRQTILRHRVQLGLMPVDSPLLDDNVLMSLDQLPCSSASSAVSSSPPSCSVRSCSTTSAGSDDLSGTSPDTDSTPSVRRGGRVRNGSVSYAAVASAPAAGSADVVLQDFHGHRVLPCVDRLRPLYRLYAVSCHTGILAGGHYVCYAHNPDGRWYFYNDSSCKEVSESAIDTSAAYLLFYERVGLDCERYMPDVSGKPLDKDELQQECETELKSMCCVS